jgi:YVTN family beta-propeller protein
MQAPRASEGLSACSCQGGSHCAQSFNDGSEAQKSPGRIIHRDWEQDNRHHQPLAYVTNAADNTVSVIDTTSNKVLATIPVGQDPTGVAITSDGTQAYVTNQLDDSVSVIDTANNKVVATINNKVVATIPGFVIPTGVAVTPDRTHTYGRDNGRHQSFAYVTNNVPSIDGSNFPASAVSVINTASNKVSATIPVGQDPNGVAITADGTHAYVANQRDGTASVINTAHNKVVATIRVGPGLSALPSHRMRPTHPSTAVILVNLSPM